MKKWTLMLIPISWWACQSNNHSAETVDKKTEIPPTFTIQEPIKGAAPEAEVFVINTEQDTSFVTDYGHVIEIPKEAFVDKNGNAIKGEVSIEFTDYNNPADVVLSGIPMQMIEGNDTNTFQSAGMFDFEAYTFEHQEIDLAENKKVNIGMRSIQDKMDYNLYYFDTLKGEWMEKEKNLKVLDKTSLPIKPINKATVDNAKLISVNIENPNLRPMYQMWDKSKFKLYGFSEPQCIYNDSIWWYDITVKSSDNPNVFELSFNGVDGDSRQYSEKLMVQPLIDSSHFENEMALFKSNLKKYFKEVLKQKETLERLEAENIKYLKLFAEERYQDSVRQVEQRIQDSLYFLANQQRVNQIVDNQNNQPKMNEKTDVFNQNNINTEVMRTFSINKTGIYNCDRFYKSEFTSSKWVTLMSGNTSTRYEILYLIDPRRNVTLRINPMYSGDSFRCAFARKLYYFVGTSRGELYLGSFYPDNSLELNLDMSLLTIEDFRKLMD